MVEPTNLRQFRKLKKRQEKEKAAETNRKQHGISTRHKKLAKHTNTKNISTLDGHKLSGLKDE